MDDSMDYSTSPRFLKSESLSPSASTSFDDNECTQSKPIETGTTDLSKRMTITDGLFFKIIPEKCIGNTTVATCVRCEPKYIEIKGTINSSSNFLCHLKRRHGRDAIQEYRRYLHTKKRYNRLRKISTNVQNSNSTPSSSKQLTLKGCNNNRKDQLEQNVLKFIIHAIQPLETVTSSYFVDIFKGLNIPESELQVLNHNHLYGKLNECYEKTHQQLKLDLSKAKEVCGVSMIWNRLNDIESCLIITAHWIDCEMTRRSAVLKIKKLSLEDDYYDTILPVIDGTKVEFNLTNCIMYYPSTNIDRWYIIKAMKKFQIYNRPKLYNTIDMHFKYTEKKERIFMSTYILEPLMLNISCYAQALMTFGSFDVINIIFNCPALKDLHQKVMEQCNRLWMQADKFKEISGHELHKPSTKTWTSVYKALDEIIKMKDNNLIFQELEDKVYFEYDCFDYLEELLTCTKSIFDALALLEDPKHSLYGSLLPTLIALRRHLTKLSRRKWEYCGPLVQELENKVNEKFHSMYKFESPEAIEAAIAAISHPEFKDRWLRCVEANLMLMVLQKFKEAVAEYIVIEPPRPNDNIKKENDFFDFESDSGMGTKAAAADIAVMNYFKHPSRNLDSLKHFPEIKSVFLRYNTPLSSLLPVEQLQDYVILEKVLGSTKVLDQNVEKEIWLKANRHLWHDVS